MAVNNLLAVEFDGITTFLAEHQWIFDFKLTRIFQDSVLDNMPEEWKKTLTKLSLAQLAGLPFGSVQQSWPESLKTFIEKCMQFSLPREITVSCPKQYQFSSGSVSPLGPCTVEEQLHSDGKLCSISVDRSCSGIDSCGERDFKTAASARCKGENKDADFKEAREFTQAKDIFTRFTPLDVTEVDSDVRKGMSEKKMHEVCHMTSLIDHVTRIVGNNGVVDVGSGLGYLGQVLHSNYGHSVLGLEGKQGHTNGAGKRLNKFECSHQLHNVTCELYQEAESQQEFMFLVRDWFSKLNGRKCSHQKTESENSQTDGTQSFKIGSSRKQEQITATKSIQTDRNRFAYQTGSSNNQTDSTLSLKTRTSSIGAKSLSGSIKSGCSNTDSEVEFSFWTIPEETEGTNFETKNNQNAESEQTTRECSASFILQSYHGDENHQNCAKKCESSLKSDMPQLCMVGLHCCGDLTPTMLKYFVDQDIITSLCCVSCCYHRMSNNESCPDHSNFPMSMLLKESVMKTQRNYPDFKFSSYSLRLAAQETRARWHEQSQMDHDFHMKNVAYRGVLETCLDRAEERFQFKKCVRKLAHKADYESFTKYIDAILKHIQMPDEAPVEEFKQFFHTEMQKKYYGYHQYFCLIEPLTALQYLLQPVIESLIYRDRKQWLKEQGYQADIIPVFNELISPRNLALIACKESVLNKER